MDALSGNALEAPSISLMPEIGAAMARLRAAGARVARMSGSGSAVFGVFRTAAEALRAAEALPGAIFTWTMLKTRRPRLREGSGDVFAPKEKSHGLEPGITRGARQLLFSAAASRP